MSASQICGFAGVYANFSSYCSVQHIQAKGSVELITAAVPLPVSVLISTVSFLSDVRVLFPASFSQDKS